MITNTINVWGYCFTTHGHLYSNEFVQFNTRDIVVTPNWECTDADKSLKSFMREGK